MARARLAIRRGTARDLPIILALIRGLAEYEHLAHQMEATASRLRRHGFGRRPYFETLICRRGRAPVGFALYFYTYSTFLGRPSLYAESLGDELGVYPNRRDRLDMLYNEQFRAARLVVDVGLHDKGWTKQRAIDYLGGSRENAEREVERYMAWPGQALGYKIGQLKIRGLRMKAQAALGPAFDVRAFHDELLGDGALPLSILEAKVDRWIGAQKSRRP